MNKEEITSCTFHTNLFCIINSAKDKIIFNFDNSKVIFVNQGKQYDIPISGVSSVHTSSENIYELIIISESFEEAFHIADLIKCSMAVIRSEKSLDLECLRNALAESCSKSLNTPHYYSVRPTGGYYSTSPELLFAAQMASKAYGRAKEENAIYKYDMARDLIDINPLDLSPNNDLSDRIYFHSEQLKFAYAIITCYSIIEELNLEIKANSANPSMINNGTEWNPSVLQDLKNRLKTNNIDPDITIPWIVRDSAERPFKSVVCSENYCEWSNKKNIRDFQIAIYDAILELSYIRDKLASHGVSDRVYKLTIYDTENAYALLRKILLLFFFSNDEQFFNWYEGFHYLENS